MKFQITEPGVYEKNADGDEVRVPVGTVIAIKGNDVPARLVGKGREVDAETKSEEPTKPEEPKSATPPKPPSK